MGNGIGEFVIGVSPIGTLPPFDYRATIISQYANSPTLLQLIESLNGYFDQTINAETFFDMIWNVNTAQGYGLDVWGRIVGVGRILQVADVEYFNFYETGLDGTPWSTAIFYTGAPLTGNFALTDAAYRQLILAKAAANITDGSVPGINAILMTLFAGRGDAYVIDNLDMTMTYRFHFVLTPVERAIVEQSGVLPRPAGVAANFVQGP